MNVGELRAQLQYYKDETVVHIRVDYVGETSSIDEELSSIKETPHMNKNGYRDKRKKQISLFTKDGDWGD